MADDRKDSKDAQTPSPVPAAPPPENAELSDEELGKVAGGRAANIRAGARPSLDDRLP